MAGVRVKGKDRNALSLAADFFLRRLVHPNLLRRLDIKIEVASLRPYNDKYVGRNGVKYSIRKVDWGAACHDLVKKPRKFWVELNKKNRPSFQLRILAHELVHVAQFATGRLREEVEDEIYWNGERVDLPYKEQPWEIEARRLAKNLVAAYKRSTLRDRQAR